MKKIFLILLILNSIYLTAFVDSFAVSPTPKETPKETEKANSDLINELKDRIASRVAQLKLVERRGIIGTVTDIADTQITISDLQNETRFIDVDELTKFSSPSAKGSFGISDITKGSKIGILGLYNKQTKRMLARFVDVLNLPKSVHGSIIEKDTENYALIVLSENGKKTTVDIEKITKTTSFTKEDQLVKSGFSKIKGSERVIIIGFRDIKDKNRIVASRIILFPDIPRDPKIVAADPAVKEDKEVKPSTGSGKKLTPLTK